jgi:hypothetical protein
MNNKFFISKFKNSKILSLIYFFTFSFIIILINKDIYLQPFYLTPQESQPALQTYISSLATFFRSDYNFIVAKSINENFLVKNFEYHWGNIFFLLFSPFVKLFGLNYLIGRSFAILLNLVGIYLILNYFKKTRILSIVFFPLLIFLPSFKNGLSFLYVDSLFFILIGIFLFLYKKKINNYFIFTFILFFALSVHYILIVIFFFLFFEFILKKISKSEYFIYFISLFLIFLIVLFFLFLTNSNYELLIAKINSRSLSFYDNFFFNLNDDTIFRRIYLFFVNLKDNFGLFSIFMIIVSSYSLYKEKSALFSLYFGVIFYFFVLYKYTIQHNFLQIQFIFFSYLVLINFFYNFFFNKKIFFLILFIFLFVFNIFNLDINKNIYSKDKVLEFNYYMYKNALDRSYVDKDFEESIDSYGKIYPLFYKLEMSNFFYFSKKK